jgi:hypothetical protein
MTNWKITRFGHASKGRKDSRIDNEIRGNLSRKRITVTLQYSVEKRLDEVPLYRRTLKYTI